MMEYVLKNGKTVLVRAPRAEDAEALVTLMQTADAQTRFLARNPGEFITTVAEERAIIEKNTGSWFVAEYEGKIVGQCSVNFVRMRQRYLHRAMVAFTVLKDYWGLGIGGRMMQECLRWCESNGVEQVELDVVAENERALNMYKNFGFEIVGTLPRALKYPDGTYADEYRMVKRL